MRNYAKKRKIRRYIFTIIILSIASYSAIFYFSEYKKDDFIIAKINNEEISKNEILYKISEIFSSNSSELKIPEIKDLPKEVIETFAREIYLEKKLLKKAKKSKISKNKKVKNKIEQAKNRILIDSYLENEIAKNISEEKIKEKYAEISDNIQGKREFLMSSIILKSENEANRIYRIYNETSPSLKRRKFKNLAKKYSIDKESAKNGGNLGFVLEDNIEKEILEEISSFKNSGYIKPVKTDFGWHIVVVRKIRNAKLPSFEKSYENLKNEIIKDTTDGIYEEIFQNYQIEILAGKEIKTGKNLKSEDDLQENSQ